MAAASNNDPTTVATLAVVGATTGYALCWLVLLIVPMLALVQALAADVGSVCKTSLQGAIRRHYGIGWAVAVLCVVAAVNVATLAADVKAGSDALALLTHVPPAYWIVPFVIVVAYLLLTHSYRNIERYLSVLPIAFVCYAASAIVAHFDVGAFLRGMLIPHFALSPLYAFAAIALLGTTLTGYVYVWESIGVAERSHDERLRRRFERDAFVSMLVVGVIFMFILVASAATLGKHHVAVQSAGDMALALEPLAGPWTSTLFGLGLLASAILAVPVIGSTTAYVAAHTFGWAGSLSASYRDARAFYGVLLASLGFAALLAFAPLTSIAMLFAASIAGGLATPLTLAFLMLVVTNRTIMGTHRASRVAAALGWGITGLVTVAGAAFLVSLRLS